MDWCTKTTWTICCELMKTAIRQAVDAGDDVLLHHYKKARNGSVRNWNITKKHRVNILRQEQNGCHIAGDIFKCVQFNALRPMRNGRHFADDIFKLRFLEWKCKNVDHDFTAVCSQGSHQQYFTIGSDNGLAMARRQAIVCTSYDRKYKDYVYGRREYLKK